MMPSKMPLIDGSVAVVPDNIRRAPDLPEAVVTLQESLSKDFFRDSGLFRHADGKTFVTEAPLEELDPSEAYRGTPLDGTDALQRQCIAAGVRVYDDLLRGIASTTWNDLFRDKRTAALVPFLMARWVRMGQMYGTEGVQRWQQIASGLPVGARFYASNNPVSSSLNPAEVARAIQADSLRQSILPLMIAVRETTDGTPYEAFVVTHTAASERLQVVGEGEPPRVISITGTTRTHRPFEVGAVIEASSRVSAQWSLPLVQQHFAWVGEQNELDKEQVAYEAAINGDGVAAAATNTNVSSLTGGASSTVTLANLLEFLRLFEGNGSYRPTIALGTSAVLSRLDESSFGSGNFPTLGPVGIALLAGQGAAPERRLFPPMFARSYCTANKLLLFDGSKNLRLKESPLLIETDRVIDRRLDRQVITQFTYVDVINDGGRRTLDTEN